MVLIGGVLYLVLLALLAWFGITLWACRYSLKGVSLLGVSTVRQRAAIAGIVSATMAVLSLLLLHLTWLSADISQRLGIPVVRALSLCLFFASIAGLLSSVAGVGRIRFFGIGTCLITGLWWFTLYISSGIAMGAPIVRHPTKFLIPTGYVGWVEIKYGVKQAAQLQIVNGSFLCQFPKQGIKETSSVIEDGWAKDAYFYYSETGPGVSLRDTGWGDGGMIWASEDEWLNVDERTRVNAYFFVGTEEQYRQLGLKGERRAFNQSTE